MSVSITPPRVFTRIISQVCQGFGRGSKELGCPTANLSEDAIAMLPDDMIQGVYYGWAKIEGDIPRKSVMSIGWNPFFKNKTRSAEVHVMHKFEDDFYGKEIRVVVLGRLRGEKDFDSLDALIEAINTDIRNAKNALSTPEYEAYLSDELFTDST
eukprot:m.163677 g.163677  ORF g.163677 m.163677 type:complete len:155 (+) comp18110_c0_seq1:235-699(+)